MFSPKYRFTMFSSIRTTINSQFLIEKPVSEKAKEKEQWKVHSDAMNDKIYICLKEDWSKAWRANPLEMTKCVKTTPGSTCTQTGSDGI